MTKRLLPLPAVMLLLTTLFLAGGCATHAPDKADRFEIGLLGDQQYDADSTARFAHLMAHVDRTELAFVVHVGDIGNPSYGSCLDETYYRRRDEFNASRHPFFFTPGDNEWTDCHQAGIPDSVERLDKVRSVFFAERRSFGKRTVPLESQRDDPRYGKYRENLRWHHGGVLFVTLNVPGSNNNLGRTKTDDAEYAERNAANLAWLRQAFKEAKARRSIAVMILFQANPQFEANWPASRRRQIGIANPPAAPSGYTDLLRVLREEVTGYDRPVALVHGDTHYFRVDKPMVLHDGRGAGRGSVVEHFTRVEVFGYPEAHWVRATIDPSDPNVFTFRPALVEENLSLRK